MRILVLLPVLLLAICAPLAHADSSGQIPGPGTCDYPAIGDWGMIGEGVAAEYYWYCDEPAEPANNSHRHCEYEGAASEFNGNISLFIFQVGLSSPVGGVFGGCHYRCPNNALSKEPMPNPPGLWLLGQKADLSKSCISVGDPLPIPNVLKPPGPDDVQPSAPSPGATPAGPIREVP